MLSNGNVGERCILTKNPVLKPVLKWVGGKRQLLPELLPLIPQNTIYVEPFVGGAAVLLGVQPNKARINDANEELINVYRSIRDNPDEVLKILKEHEMNNSSEYYYEIRGLDRSESYSELSSTQRAARIIYLNKTCYNGLFRVNSRGQLNVPYGRYKNPDIVQEPAIQALSRYLNDNEIEILSGDYKQALKDLPRGAFVYLDPPYMPVSKTSSFTGYTEGGFTYEEQRQLRDCCIALREQGIRFIQSNSDCDAIRELYEDFRIKVVRARRAINSNGNRRGPVNEVIIINE